MSKKLDTLHFLNIDGESPMRCTLLAVFSLALMACVTETTTIGGSNPPPRQNTAKKSEPAPAKKKDPNDIIKLPPEVMEELIGFVNRKHFLLADRIEVDASRVPFHSALVPVNDDRYVEKVEMANTTENAVGILLRTRAKMPLVERDRPRLRVGDGMELVAAREIRIRTYTDIDRKRPVFLMIQGVGHAVYHDEVTGKRLEKDAIVIRAEVVEGKNGPEFRSKVL